MKKTENKNAKMKEVQPNAEPCFSIEGRVHDTYQGKKRQYVTVRNTSKEGFYSDFSISCDKDIEFEENELLRFNGKILVFYNKEKQRSEYVFSAETIEEVY